MRNRLGAVFVLGAMVVGMVAPVGALGQTSQPLFEQIDVLDRFPEDARAALGAEFVPTWEQVTTDIAYNSHRGRVGAIMIPERRQLWQIYFTSVPQGSRYAAVVRDLDTLQIVQTVSFPKQIKRATRSEGGDWSHVVDVVHGRLFLVTLTDRSVLEVNLKSFALREWLLPASAGPFPFLVGGLAYDPHEDDLLLLYGGLSSASVANTNTFVYTLDVSGPPQNEMLDTAQSLRNLRQMRSCTAPVTSTDSGGDTYNWEILVTSQYLYVPCQLTGHIGAVVRTVRSTPQDPIPREDFVAGPIYAVMVLADQKSGRLFMSSIEREVWVFEAETMSFIGVVATADDKSQPATGGGLDTATGRFFFQSPHFGLGVVEGRFFPVPQARVDRNLKAPGRERILSDAKTNRVFVLEGDYPRYYKIYRTGPAPLPPPPPDPDFNTADLEEAPGVTEAKFFSSGSGYGLRSIWLRGWGAIVPVPVLGVNAPTAGATDAGPCGATDREFSIGRVYRAEYDTGSTSAKSIAVDVDERTKQDLALPSRCGGNIPPQSWNRNPATCSSSEGGKEEEGVGKADDLGPSKVTCPLPGGTLKAYAEFRPATLPPELQESVSVGKAWTETTITRLSRGILSETTSVAQDIDIGGLVHIAEVKSHATSFSNGRPSKKDMSTHTVTIRGVKIGEDLVCNDCVDLKALISTLNQIPRLRAQFRTGSDDISGLDPGLKRGSPKGALTAVQKSEARQASDRAIVGDQTTDVPGLEVTVYNDNSQWGRARQIYQFAGVSTVANYNIVPLPTGSDFNDFDDQGEDNSDFYGTEDQSPEGGSFDPLFAFADENNGSSTPTGNFIVRAIKKAAGAVAKGMRLFLTNPRQFLLLLTAWGLFSLPPILSRRRRLLGIARSA